MDKSELLIEKDDANIRFYIQLANDNAKRLQDVHALCAIPDQLQALRVVSNMDSILRVEMEKAHKHYLGAFDVINLKVPEDVAQLKKALQALKESTTKMNKQINGASGFQFCKYDGKKWIVDEENLNTYLQRFYHYADPEKFSIAQDVANALNRIPNLYDNQKIHTYKTAVTVYDPNTNLCIPDKSFIRA